MKLSSAGSGYLSYVFNAFDVFVSLHKVTKEKRSKMEGSSTSRTVADKPKVKKNHVMH